MQTQQTSSLVELFERSCQEHAARPVFATKTPAGWRWLTYGELAELVDECRAGLASLGVGDGDRVAIVSNNRVEWAVIAYATYGRGAVLVPMYEAQRPNEWEFILNDCGAKVVLGSNERVVRALEEMKPRLPLLEHVIGIEREPNGTASYEGILERGRRYPVAAKHPEATALAGLVYTSGTTGKPKGVMLTHGNIVSNVQATLQTFPLHEDDRTLSFLPWAHAYGQVIELHVLVAAGTSTAFNTEIGKLVDEMAEVRPTILVAVPRIFNKLHGNVMKQLVEKPKSIRALVARAVRTAAKRRNGLKPTLLDELAFSVADRLVFAKVRKRLGGRLKYAISASATLSLDVAEFVDACGIEVYEGYGLTETSPVVSTNAPNVRRLGSVGRPIPGVTIAIDESVYDKPGSGEVVVFGPNVMKGYYKRPDEDAKAFTPDGGLRTGDIGHVDAHGFLFITGRIKEQYKLENGKYVMPAPLEETLKLSPFIANVMLYGANRAFNVALVALDLPAIRAWAAQNAVNLGDDPTRVVAVQRLIESELRRLAESFREFEKPRAFALITEDFTVENGLLTPTLKLKRRHVTERYAAMLDALYDEEATAEHAVGPLV